jgi:hypothetical protein
MPYYGRGDYRRGYYRRGDPGLLGGLWGAVTGGVKGLITGGPVGALTGAVKGGIAGLTGTPQTAISVTPNVPISTLGSLPAPMVQVPSTTPGAVPTPGFGGLVSRILPGGQTGYEVPLRGYHMSATGTWVKNRRMNVTNPRALRRSIRRVSGFGKLVHRIKRAVARANVAVGNRHYGRKGYRRR